ncbi:HD domain-containing protein [Pseudarthrobacter sp. BRE9]|uniref:HD domain-containing protein n=1 Tax=Pseudarthrobacter sp. BRE9 TaxID=2962582 RepID=UPI002882B12B|nr:HD domain-containing protein [Pseudarthrobacter sp. BRE9]MDT0169453.1 HD domain-containing protein [Pseudarthrobacter sp. BRE9]
MKERQGPTADMDAAARPEIPLSRLRRAIFKLLTSHSDDIPYHGWPHVRFVADHGARLAAAVGADSDLVAAAGLVHDLNYLVRPGSQVKEGITLMRKYLRDAGYNSSQMDRVTSIVLEADLATRGPIVSSEVACLSDADSLFKVLPVTPVLLARDYLKENHVSLKELAESIIGEQASRLEEGYYFYTDEAKDLYDGLARQSIIMWNSILESLENDEVSLLVEDILAPATSPDTKGF